MGVIKANWDAANDLQNQRMGVGAIVRNAEGLILASLCATVPYITDPSVVEVMMLWKTITLYRELDIQNLHIKGDALEIVWVLLLQDPCWSSYGHFVEDTRTLLNSFYSRYITHIHKEANEAAHRLANAAVHQSLNHVWRDSPLLFVYSIVFVQQSSLYE